MTEPTVPRRRIIIKGLAVGVIDALVWAVQPFLWTDFPLLALAPAVYYMILAADIALSVWSISRKGLDKWLWSCCISVVFAWLLCAPFVFYHRVNIKNYNLLLTAKVFTVPILSVLQWKEHKRSSGSAASGKTDAAPAESAENGSPLSRPVVKGVLVAGILICADILVFLAFYSTQIDYAGAMLVRRYLPIPTVLLCIWVLCRRVAGNWGKSFGIAVIFFAMFGWFASEVARSCVGGFALILLLLYVEDIYELLAIPIGAFIVYTIKLNRQK